MAWSSSSSTRSPRRSTSPFPRMEAATLRRGGATRLQSLCGCGPLALARLLDRRRADRAGGAAALRHPRRPELPPRRGRHRQPHPPRRLRPRDGSGQRQASRRRRSTTRWPGSGPRRPANTEYGLRSLSALAGVATVPVAYLIGAELRGRRAGLMAAALVAVNPMLLWYSQEARAYALLVLLCARLDALLLPRRARRPAAQTSCSGASSRGWRWRPITSRSSRSSPRRRCCCGGAAGRASAGSRSSLLAGLAAGAAGDPPDVERPRRVDQRPLARPPRLGNRGDLRQRRDRRHHRPAGAAGARLRAAGALPRRLRPAGACAATATSAAPPALPLVVGARRASGSRSRWRCSRRARTSSSPATCCRALIPLLVVVAIAVTMPSARRLGAALGGALLAYSLGFCVWVSVSPDLQRPNWDAVAARLGEPAQPRAMVTWTIGEAPLRYYLATGAIQVRRSRRLRLAGRTKSTSSPRATCRRRAAGMLGPALPRSRAAKRPARC